MVKIVGSSSYSQDQEFSKNIISSSIDGIMAFDRQCRYTVWNSAMERISGVPANQALGSKAFELFPLLVETGEDKVFRRVLKGESLTTRDRPFVCEKGRPGFYEAHYSPLKNNASRIVGGLAIIRDITQQKKVESELRTSESKFRSVVDSNMVGFIFWDHKGAILQANDAFLRMVGYTRRDLEEGRLNWKELTPPEYLDTVEKVANKELEEKGVCTPFQKEYLRKDGSRVPVLIGEAFLPGLDHGVCFAIEITELKNKEAEIEESRYQLRELAARIESVREIERTGIAREIHDELGQLLTGLRLGLSSLLKMVERSHPEEVLTMRIKEMMSVIDRSIKSVRKIATDLRPAVLDELGLRAAIKWESQEFERRTGIKCVVKTRWKGPEPSGERGTAVFRIFQEVLLNITRHSKASMVFVTLTLDQKGIVLDVTDNGKGMSTKKVNRSKSLGILGMKERAIILGGTVVITGEKNLKTQVVAKIPLH
ncbi:MAG: PAS domain S-box protein [Verrucomicrobiota bacterium]|nr:PAS domain S-box protein [Verrucomicrobiota bacterium]